MSVSAAVARPVRTAGQLTVAGIITEFVDAFHVYDLDERQYAVLLALLTVLLSWVQVLVENWLNKGVLREPNTPDVPGDGPGL